MAKKELPIDINDEQGIRFKGIVKISSHNLGKKDDKQNETDKPVTGE